MEQINAASNGRVVVRRTTIVAFDALSGYLGGKAGFDNKCLEAVNFLDHLLRETPRQQYTQIKRSFFARGQERYILGNAVEAFKGVYQSPRLAHGLQGARLTINLDVANGAQFFDQGPKWMQRTDRLQRRRDVSDRQGCGKKQLT